jgi:hypothetical protein
MIREVRQFSALVGRRTALRYATLGLLAATLEACGASGKGDSAGNQSGAGGRPAGAAGVKAMTLEAFVKGKWKVAANGGSCLLTVADGKWSLSDGTEAVGESKRFLMRELHGTYQLHSGVMEVAVLEGDNDTTPKNGLASKLPAEVTNPADVLATWNYDRNQFEASFNWDGRQMVLFFSHRTGGYIKFTAERA